MADQTNRHRNRTLPTIWVFWFLAGTFGDEIVGVILFGLESDALLMSLTKRWWWIYQGVLLAICLIVSIAMRIWSSKCNAGESDRSK